MKKVGKIINFTGKVLGAAIEYKIKFDGEVIGALAEAANKKEFGEKSRKAAKNIGEALGKATKKTSYYAAKAADKTIDLSETAAKKIKGAVVKEDITEINQYGEVRKIKYVDDVDYKVIDDK